MNGGRDHWMICPVAEAVRVAVVAAITGGTWDVMGDNTWGIDFVGPLPQYVLYYREQRPLQGLPVACGYTMPQRMVISCRPGVSRPAYANHTLTGQMDSTYVGVGKDGMTQWREWP
jgi:hypothetical protein